ncbi:hypothetical protein Cgig2_030523 [Carnegiea gigantea]|uniref:Uncharacterized protein n=1 Tax=Carnegiea gigantea TaxID=171969 RepID=A0A9Q1K083_9CARY|nr:hypothetical protein Cgig2_030523 [Carnegiea gigantea]
MQNDSNFNAGVNEDDHLTPLQPQGSTDKSVCTPSPDKEDREDEEGGQDERTVDPNIEQSEAKIDGCNRMNNKKKRRSFKPHGPNRYRTVCPIRVHSWNDIDKSAKEHMRVAVKEEIIQTSKDNPHFSAFELVEECFGPQDCDHVAYFRYGMKPNDVRGPLPTRAALQAMLREKEKENIALHKRIDDMENAHKNDMDKLEDQVRMLANLVMANQQTSTKFGANTGSDEDDV